jgi:hypothetical protein
MHSGRVVEMRRLTDSHADRQHSSRGRGSKVDEVRTEKRVLVRLPIVEPRPFPFHFAGNDVVELSAGHPPGAVAHYRLSLFGVIRRDITT